MFYLRFIVNIFPAGLLEYTVSSLFLFAFVHLFLVLVLVSPWKGPKIVGVYVSELVHILLHVHGFHYILREVHDPAEV